MRTTEIFPARYNRIEKCSDFSNTLIIIRHGHSQANQDHIIASWPSNAIDAYGLSEKGKMEVSNSVASAIDNGLFNGRIVIYSSTFLRTIETSHIIESRLNTGEVASDDRLRERNFGDLELGNDDKYQMVWDADEIDPGHKKWNVESPIEVFDRITEFVFEINERHKDRKIVLVTHCDVAMILICGFLSINPAYHRKLEPIRTAEIKIVGQIGKIGR